MVVFTCNHCGETVQKPRVSKHISYECKKKLAGVSLCCIDCLQDFNADTFSRHTKCVSELERYSGSNFIPKASTNKGERKQTSWISTVGKVLGRSTLSQQQRELLRAISNFENVPRKKSKFQNFVRSSVRSIRIFPDVIDSVFDILDEEFKNSAVSTSISKSGNVGKNGNFDGEENPRNDTDSAVKKGSEVFPVIDQALSIGDEQILCKKKKKKQKLEMPDENASPCDAERHYQITKKQKKKIEESNYVMHDSEKDDPILNEEKTRSEKRKKQQMGIHDEHEEKVPGNDELSKKKLKKKRKLETTDDTEGLRYVENANTEILYRKGESLDVLPVNDREERKKEKRKKGNLEILDENGLTSDAENNDILARKGALNKLGPDCFIQIGADRKERNIVANVLTDNLSKKKKKRKPDETHKNEDFVKNDTDLTSGLNFDERLEMPVNSPTQDNNVICRLGNNRTRKENSLESGDVTKFESISGISRTEHDYEESENISGMGGKFNWNEIVTSMLSNSFNGELALKKIEKKIVKQYYQFHGEQKSFEEIVRRFEKKVKKMANVDINGGKIRLRK